MPQPVSPGACIGIVAPAGMPDQELFEKGISLIRARGYTVQLADQVYAEGPHALAGKDEERAEALMAFFEDPSVDAIWMARGGYGSTRLFPFLDSGRISSFPKRFMGCSDGTALLAFFEKNCKMAAFHGPVVTQLGKLTPEALEKTFQAFEGSADFSLEDGRILQQGRGEGRLIGGNLTLVSKLIGTPWCPDFKNSLLFAEEVNEAPYRIDRMFSHLKMAGVLDKISGLLLGAFTDCGEKEEIHERILHHLPSSIPVVSDLSFGHFPKNFPLAFGLVSALDTQTLLPLKEIRHEGA